MFSETNHGMFSELPCLCQEHCFNPWVAMSDMEQKTKHGGDIDVVHVHFIAQCVFNALVLQWH